MRNAIKSVVLVVLFIGLNGLQAQERLKVLVVSGNVEWTNSSGKSSLVTGTWIEGNYTLELAADAYIGFISEKGKTLQVNQEGAFTAQQINALLNKQKESSLTAKYAEYLLNGGQQDVREKIKVTGAVERAGESDVSFNLPDKSKVFGNELIVSWSGDASEEFEILVTDLYDQKLAVYYVSQNELDLDLDQKTLKGKETVILWIKSTKDADYSHKVALQRISKEEFDLHNKAIQEIASDDRTALNEFLKGVYYLENGLYADAFTSFTLASKMAPDVQTYNKMYNQWFAMR